MSARLTLTADFDAALAELAALGEAAELFPEIGRRLVDLVDAGQELFRLDLDLSAAAATGNVILRAQLADAYRVLLPTAGTGDIERRVFEHGAASATGDER